MKNAMILFGIWVGIILAAYALVYMGDGGSTPAEIALAEQIAARTYVDPAGRFQLEIPAGWRIGEIEDGVRVVDPLDQIEMWIVAFGGSVDGVIDYACHLAEPCPGMVILEREELIPPVGARSRMKIVYETGDKDVTLYAIGVESGSGSLVLLIRCMSGACDERTDELERLAENLIALDLEGLPLPPSIPVPGPSGGTQTEALDIEQKAVGAQTASIPVPTDDLQTESTGVQVEVAEPQTASLTPEP